jgi:hypothetical protein
MPSEQLDIDSGYDAAAMPRTTFATIQMDTM